MKKFFENRRRDALRRAELEYSRERDRRRAPTAGALNEWLRAAERARRA